MTLEWLGVLLMASYYLLGFAAIFALAALVIALIPWAVAMLFFGPLSFLYFWLGGGVVALGIMALFLF